jgi:glycosyltransferase involved in cell wall biosynthesis
MSDIELQNRIELALSRSDVRHVATSKVVETMLESIGVDPIAIINAGLLEEDFGIDVPIKDRKRVIVFPYRPEASKDVSTALSAAESVLLEEAGVAIECFGKLSEKPLPNGIRGLGHVSDLELRALYNRASIFLLTSRYEGWGLPAAEAMACGAAVISTANGGVEDFLENEFNGLLVPIADENAVAAALLKLLRDDALRVRLATNGANSVANMTVQHSCDQLEQLLTSLLSA